MTQAPYRPFTPRQMTNRVIFQTKVTKVMQDIVDLLAAIDDSGMDEHLKRDIAIRLDQANKPLLEMKQIVDCSVQHVIHQSLDAIKR